MKLPGDMTVTSRVNGADTKSVRIAPGTPVKKGAGSPADGAGSTGSTGTAVQITGAARDIAAIEQSLREMPAIDEARVAAVRQRLDDGSYSMDPQRMADRLLYLDQNLARAHPIESSLLK